MRRECVKDILERIPPNDLSKVQVQMRNAFVLSIDDYVVTSFTAGNVQTFPLWIYGVSKLGLPPQADVMGTLIFAAGLLIAGSNVLISRRRAR